MIRQAITSLALALSIIISANAGPIARPPPARSIDLPKSTAPSEFFTRSGPRLDGAAPPFRVGPDKSNLASKAIFNINLELSSPKPDEKKISDLLEEIKRYYRDRDLEIRLASILDSAPKKILSPIDASSPDFLVRRPLSPAYDTIVKEVLDRKLAKLSHRIDRDQVISLSFVSSTDGKEAYNRSIPLAKRLRGRLADRLASGDFDALDGNYFAAARGKSLVVIGHVVMQADGPAFEIRRDDNTFRYVSFKEIDAAAHRFEFSIVLLGCDTGDSVSVGTAKKINDVTAIKNLEHAMQRRDTSTLRELIVDLSSPDLQFVMGTDRPDDGTLVPFDLADGINPTSAPGDSDDSRETRQNSYGAAGGGGGGNGGGGGSPGGNNFGSSGSSSTNIATAPLLTTTIYWGQSCEVSDHKLDRSKYWFHIVNFVYNYWLLVFGISILFWWLVSISELPRRRSLPSSIRSENVTRILAAGLGYYFFYRNVFDINFTPVQLMMGKYALTPSFWTIVFVALAIWMPIYFYMYMRKKMPDHIWSIIVLRSVLAVAAVPVFIQIIIIIAAAECAIVPLMPLH